MMKTRVALVLLLLTSVHDTLSRAISENENNLKIIIPDDFTPNKQPFLWQRQIILLFVPTAGLGVGGGGFGGGVPIGGLYQLT